MFGKKHSPSAETVSSTVAPETPAPQLPTLPARQLSYRVGNLQSVGRRPRQEDSFCFVNAMDVHDIQDKGLLAVVADGMGGMAGGKQASETVIAVLRQSFAQMDRQEDLSAQLCAALREANAQVFQLLHCEGGSTVVACIFYQQQLWFASVGDSSLYLLRGGELLRLNREQNVCNQLYLRTIDRGSTDPTAGRSDWERDALTHFMGMPELEEIDCLLRPLPLQDGDRVLICSDGVSDVVPDPMLQDILRLPNPTEICDALTQAVENANNPYQDNFTALVVQCVL